MTYCSTLAKMLHRGQLWFTGDQRCRQPVGAEHFAQHPKRREADRVGLLERLRPARYQLQGESSAHGAHGETHSLEKRENPVLEQKGDKGPKMGTIQLVLRRGVVSCLDNDPVDTAAFCLHAQHPMAQLAAVEAGMGLGFISELALNSRPYLKVVKVGIQGMRFRRTFYLAHEQAPLSAIVQAFVRFVAAESPYRGDSA